MKLSKEIKAAVFVLLGIFLFLIGFNFLNGTSLFKSESTLYAVYDQVEGLQSGTKVTVNGLTVGKVSSINFLPSSDKILVSFTVRNDLKFSKNSIAEIYEAGLIGGKSIAIVPVYDTDIYLISGDTLQSRIKPGLTDVVGSEIAPLQEKLNNILINADTLISSLNTVLDDQAQRGLNKAMSEISTKISQLLTHSDIKCDVQIIYQSIEDLHKACPGHKGDWYFTGNYPTAGGNKVVNKAFINYMDGKNERAY